MNDNQIHLLLLRNDLPQNIDSEVTAREVAKDIVQNDIPYYLDYPERIQSGIKYLLIGGLMELYLSLPENERTLGKLFEWARVKTLVHEHTETNQYFDMLEMLPQDDINLARFYICDRLMKYYVCSQKTAKQVS